jgi:flagellar biosynthesis/type III secretory pathway protein FliH
MAVVLYSGEKGWTAATEIGELIESVPGGLDRYRPQMRYLLVEERGFSDEELAPMRNLVAALFRLENSRNPEDIIQVLELLIEWLRAPEQADLARALVVWLRRSLLASRMPDIDIPEIENLQEARTMLAERVKDWKKQWQEEARKEGEEEGRKAGEMEGRKAGESTILVKQLTRKFGAMNAETERRIADASSDQLQNWAERILTADNIDEVFG